MSGRSVPVAIVGGGPTGVTAATLLAQHGVECLVLDRWHDVYPQPRAVHIDDEVFRIIAQLGLREDFAAISRPALGLRLLDPRMRVLAQFHRGTTGVHGFPTANMFDQPDLERMLRANLRRHGCVELRGGVDVVAIAQPDGGPVQVDYLDRERGVRETVTAEYVLGCDGANSMVRAAVGARMEDLHFEQRWLVVDVATAQDLGAWEGVHQVCDPRRAATFMRIGDTRYRWEFRLHDGERAADFADMRTLHPLIAPWTSGVRIEELQVVRVAEYTFRAQLADRWRDRRVFLLGDAAHLTPPFIGQGLCAGMRDAHNLAWKLAAVLDGAMPAHVLDSYERERKPHVRALIRLAVGIGWAMTRGGETGNALRALVAPRLHLIPGMRAKILDSTTPPLRASALTARAPHRRLCGRLCPNAVVDGDRRFDDVAGNRVALVSATPLTADQRTAVERRGAVVVTAHAGTDLHRWLRRGLATAALVRPDRTVMHSGRDLDRLVAAIPPLRAPANAQRAALAVQSSRA